MDLFNYIPSCSAFVWLIGALCVCSVYYLILRIICGGTK